MQVQEPLPKTGVTTAVTLVFGRSVSGRADSASFAVPLELLWIGGRAGDDASNDCSKSASFKELLAVLFSVHFEARSNLGILVNNVDRFKPLLSKLAKSGHYYC